MEEAIKDLVGKLPSMDWLTQKYVGAEEDMKVWMVEFNLQRKFGSTYADLDVVYKERAQAEAKLAALDQLLNLEGVTNAAAFSILLDIDQEKLWMYAEYSSLEEFLENTLEEYYEDFREGENEVGKKYKELPGSVYEVKHLLEVVDFCEQIGIPKEQVLPIRTNFTKAKTASHTLYSIKNSDLPVEKKAEMLIETLKDIADPTMTTRAFRDKQMGRTRQLDNAKATIGGTISIVRGGDLLLLKTNGTAMTKAIQYQLRGIVSDWSVTDALSLATRITDEVSTKNKYKPTRMVVDDEDMPRLTQISGEDGLMMPTPRRFEQLVLMELGHGKYLIDEVMRCTDDKVQLPIFSFGIFSPDLTTLGEYLRKELKYAGNGSVLHKLNQAIGWFYKVPEEANGLYNIEDIYLNIRQSEPEITITLSHL